MAALVLLIAAVLFGISDAHFKCARNISHWKGAQDLLNLKPILDLESLCHDFAQNSNCSLGDTVADLVGATGVLGGPVGGLAGGLLKTVGKTADGLVASPVQCLLNNGNPNKITSLQSFLFSCVLDLNVLQICDVQAIVSKLRLLCPTAEVKGLCLSACLCCGDDGKQHDQGSGSGSGDCDDNGKDGGLLAGLLNGRRRRSPNGGLLDGVLGGGSDGLLGGLLGGGSKDKDKGQGHGSGNGKDGDHEHQHGDIDVCVNLCLSNQGLHLSVRPADLLGIALNNGKGLDILHLGGQGGSAIIGGATGLLGCQGGVVGGITGGVLGGQSGSGSSQVSGSSVSGSSSSQGTSGSGSTSDGSSTGGSGTSDGSTSGSSSSQSSGSASASGSGSGSGSDSSASAAANAQSSSSSSSNSTST